MYCAQCGSEMNEEQEVCLKCGESKHSKNISNKENIIYQIIFFICTIVTLFGAFGFLNNIRIILFDYYFDFSNILNTGICFIIFVIGFWGSMTSKKKIKL